MTGHKHQWEHPPANLHFEHNTVHVWMAHLVQEPLAIGSFHALLSEDEQAKAAKFYFERDRNRYIVAHSILHILLSRYLQCDPRIIRFRTNAYGKPALDLSQQEHSLRFNLSHSHEMALLSFTYNRELGVDIEYMREIEDYDKLARVSFSPNERLVLRELADDEKRQGFYNCWTRKEAYIKARGMGLSLPLNLFDVSLLPGEPAQLLASREDAREVSRWTMRDLSPAPGYAGALCVAGDDWSVCCYRWDEASNDQAEGAE